MLKSVSDCVGCDTCINCGNKDAYDIIICDMCKQEIQVGDRVYFYDGKDLCQYCALEALESKEVTEEGCYE